MKMVYSNYEVIPKAIKSKLCFYKLLSYVADHRNSMKNSGLHAVNIVAA